MTDIAAVIERVSDEDEDYIGSGVLIRAADRDALLAHIAAITTERDAEREHSKSWRRTLEKMTAERDAARVEVARLREALTPSAATHAAYINGFQFIFPAFNEAGDEVAFTPNVPWTTIKEIMAAIRARAAGRRASRLPIPGACAGVPAIAATVEATKR